MNPVLKLIANLVSEYDLNDKVEVDPVFNLITNLVKEHESIRQGIKNKEYRLAEIEIELDKLSKSMRQPVE